MGAGIIELAEKNLSCKGKNLDEYEGVSYILLLMGDIRVRSCVRHIFCRYNKSENFNIKSLYDLVEYYNNNRASLDEFKKQFYEERKTKYPEMKILDMAFWYMSYEKSQDKE